MLVKLACQTLTFMINWGNHQSGICLLPNIIMFLFSGSPGKLHGYQDYWVEGQPNVFTYIQAVGQHGIY
jgi:hypothetical protein